MALCEPCRGVDRGWLRVGGTVAALFGAYYLGAAFGERSGSGLRGFYVSTVVGRLLLSLAFVSLCLSQQIGRGLLVIAAINAAGAFSMWNALSTERIIGLERETGPAAGHSNNRAQQ